MPAHSRISCVFIALLGLPALLTAADPAPDAPPPPADSSPLAEFFGFLPVEIFKLHDRSESLLVGDINQDGKNDIVSCDNSHSRLDLLQQRIPGATPDPLPPVGLNSFPSDTRYNHVKLPLDKAAASLALGDFNRDGRLDIACLAMPDRLVIRFQSEQGTWKRQISLRLPDIQPAQWILAAGDLNHDQQADLALLGRKETFVFLKITEREIPQPQKLMNTNERPGLLQIQDLNGDGRQDLSYLTNDDGNSSLAVRLQSPEGELGPELQFNLNGPRAIHLADLDQKPGVEIVSIHAQTNRVRVHQISKDPADSTENTSQLVQFGLPGAGTREQELVVGDVTGDGRNDIVSIDPDAAELILYPQSETSGLTRGEKFPTLIGGTQIRLANLDQQPGDEILVLSPKEKSIGLSRSVEGRISFPKALPIQGEPLLMETVTLPPPKTLSETMPPSTGLLYVSKPNGSSEHHLYALKPQVTPAGEMEWTPLPFGEKTDIKLDLPRAPERLLLFQSGDTRLLIFYLGGDKPPRIYRLTPEFELTPLPESPQQGTALLTSKSVQRADLEQPALMVTQGNVARSLILKKSTGDEPLGWEILDQYNATETGSTLVAAAALDFDDQPGPEIALIDQGTRKIRLLRREEGTYRPYKEVELGPFACTSCQTADLNHDGKLDLLLNGKGRFAVLYAGGTEYHLKELAVFETQLDDVHFQDVTAGDLNHDGHIDLALIDTKSHRVEITSFFPGVGLKSALSFKIFDSKHLADKTGDDQEPRESLIADVTGDNLADLLLLTHDRLLLYPQDPGETSPSDKDKTAANP